MNHYPEINTQNAMQLKMRLVHDLIKRTPTPMPWMLAALKVVAKVRHNSRIEDAFQEVRAEVQRITGRDIVAADIHSMNSYANA